MKPPILNNLFGLLPDAFEAAALEVFRYQHDANAVYRNFCDALGTKADSVQQVCDIPFLPIGFFKSHKVLSGDTPAELCFESSGTTLQVPSRHYISDPALYERMLLQGFERVYGKVEDWAILGLLPSYLERGQSSLVYMVQHLMQRSGNEANAFFLHDHAALANTLRKLEAMGKPTLLIGVTYALLDFAEAHAMPLQHTVVMETGGMKGRRKELLRDEVHALLKQAFGLKQVHAEYGMTELLSQAYSKGEGIFECPPWMRVMVRDDDDPLQVHKQGRGAINVVDLANIHSCSFIATDDVGEVMEDGKFTVLGRLDYSDIRGCSLLAP
ncbi:MAG: acyl transferase [Chitinophagaceae bacterium]